MITIPTMEGLAFEDKQHIYRLNGEEIPSVSALMEPLSKREYANIDSRTLDMAANRGTNVHNAIENWIKFGFDDLSPTIHGYMDGFLDWWKLNDPEIIGSEVRIYHKLMMYAGTIDMIASINGEINLIDFKTTYRLIEKNCRVQLDGYAKALESHGIRIDKKRILHLKKDGKFRDIEFPANDPEAWRVFGSLKCIYDFLKS